jgi:hypothetical protein
MKEQKYLAPALVPGANPGIHKRDMDFLSDWV